MKEVTLRDMFFDHTGRQTDKWEHYFPIYEKHFARFRGTYVRVLEIGVDHGGSLQLWKRYFGRYAEIIGVDISPDTMFTEVQITTHCYDQVDPNIAKLGPFDIVIDDGSHVLQHQSDSFMNLWGHTRFVYLIEDCHGAYPSLVSYPEALLYHYPQVVVCEKARRSIRGTPSRRLRPDESEARRYYAR